MTVNPPPAALDLQVLDLVRDEVLQTPPTFTVDSDLFTAGLDSMAIMQLLLLLEERFGASIPVESVSRENFKSARSIASLLVARGVESRSVVTEAALAKPQLAVPAAPPESASFTRLALRDCDFFVVAFDQMLRSTGQIGHIAHSLLELEGSLDVAALRSVVSELHVRFPILTARLQRRWFIGFPEWIPATRSSPLELHLWSPHSSHGKLSSHGARSYDDYQELLQSIINAPLPRSKDAWVNARFDLVEKTDGSFVFIYTWSHLITDGVGAEHFLVELSRLLGANHEAIPPFDKDDHGSPRGIGERWKSAAPMIKLFHKLLEKPFSSLAPRNAHPSRTDFRVITLSPEQTAEAARRASEISGPLINMPFHLACAMRAHLRVFQMRGQTPASLMCSVPVQVRRKGARGPLFQNNLTMFFSALEPEQLTSLDKAARALHEQHALFLKDNQGDSFRDLMWLMRPMPPGLHMKFINWQMNGQFSSFYHSHTGVFAPELETFGGARVANAYHIPGFSSPPGTGIFANERNGRLVLTFAWREGVLSKEEQEALIDQVLTDVGAKPPGMVQAEACSPATSS